VGYLEDGRSDEIILHHNSLVRLRRKYRRVVVDVNNDDVEKCLSDAWRHSGVIATQRQAVALRTLTIQRDRGIHLTSQWYIFFILVEHRRPG